MPLAHDRSLDLLASSQARYHCTTDAFPVIRTQMLKCIELFFLQSVEYDLLHTTSGELKYFCILREISSELFELREILPWLFSSSGGTILPQEINNDVEDPRAMVHQMIKLMHRIFLQKKPVSNSLALITV